MDINKPVTNPELVNSIRELRLGKKSEFQFLNDVLWGRLLCPVNITLSETSRREGSKIELGEGTSIALPSLTDKYGDAFLMAFTDWDELRKWSRKQDQQAAVFTGEECREIIIKEGSPYQGIVINPFGDNIVLNRELMRNTMKNEQILSKGATIMLGIPKEYPTAMIERLKEYFAKTDDVNAAYLLWMVRGNDASYLLVLDSTIASQKLFSAIGRLCQPFLDEKLLDMVLADSGFGRDAIKGQEPFFKKIR